MTSLPCLSRIFTHRPAWQRGPHAFRAWRLVVLGGCLLSFDSRAAEAYVPASDGMVLEQAFAARSPQARALQQQRRALAGRPADAALAADYARNAIAIGRAQADPRYYGYAEAALSPWADAAGTPVEIAWLQAVLRQQRHDFAAARTQLDQLLQAHPGYAPALLTRATLHSVAGEPALAQRDCAALTARAALTVVVACAASAGSLLGHAGNAQQSLAALEPQLAGLPVDQRIWILTLGAEIAARQGQAKPARAAFERARREAGATQQPDPYLDVAYADFLLDQGRPADLAAVVELLSEQTRNDNALLRLCLAESRLDQAAAKAHIDELGARFADIRARGESTHAREEAMFTLHLQHDAAGALPLAQLNWSQQREPIDARILLETARAAGQPAAALPVIEWMQRTRIEDPALHRLAAATEARS